MNIKKHIPNFLTCCNLLCGCVGIAAVMYHNLFLASYCIYVACLFDFFDGFAARGLKVTSAIGKDLDSLSDMVSFGLLPGMIVFGIMDGMWKPGVEMLLTDRTSLPLPQAEDLKYIGLIPFIGFIIPVFSAIRLAKFNNDTRQSYRFIGVPTPANALFISSLPFILDRMYNMSAEKGNDAMVEITFIYMPFILIALVIILSLLLIAELPLIALKFKNFGWADNKMRYILIISALILLLTLNIVAIPIIIILYIILSIIDNKLVQKEA